MPVRINRVYTRAGDAGETALVGGRRVPKDSPRIEAYGTIDELNSIVGLARAFNAPKLKRGKKHRRLDEILRRIQNELFDLGADLSVPYRVPDRLRVTQELIEGLEALCDSFNEPLPELKSFVLPGGTKVAAALHVARTICRRAERDALAAAEEVELNPLALVYLNRLSDLLFILARAANAGGGEPLWRPGGERL